MRNLLSFIVLVVLLYGQPLLAMEVISVQDTTNKGTKASASFPKSKLGIDFIVLMKGEQREVEIRKFSTKFIFYSKHAESNMTQIDRRLVNAIYYRSGKKEVITPKAVDIPQNSEWEKIKITDNIKDINMALMIEIDIIEVTVEASTREQYVKPQTLENSAYIILRKKAAMLNGEVVLIRKKSHSRPYGEPPSLRIEATAYRKI
mgnify:CR=1 FL=1